MSAEPTALDHVVVVVPDLDEAASAMEALGFYVTARSGHPFGTSNRTVMLADTYLEFITVTDPAAVPPNGFGRFVSDALEAGRLGPRLVVFRSDDAGRDRSRLVDLGLDVGEPYRFGREAVLADGSSTRVEFVTVVPDLEGPVSSFLCQHLTPEKMWHPSLQDHPNGGSRLAALVVEGAGEAEWERMRVLSGLEGPPLQLANTTVDAGASRLVIEANQDGSTQIAGTEVELALVIA